MEEYLQPFPFSKRSSCVLHVICVAVFFFLFAFTFPSVPFKWRSPGLWVQALLAGSIHVCEAFKTRSPVTKVVIILIRVWADGIEGAERFRHRAIPLEGVRLQGIIRRGAGIHVGFFQSLPNKFPENDIIRDAFKSRSTQELDFRGHIPPGLGVSHDVEVSERGHVEGFRVFLSPTLVVVSDDVFSDISLFVENQGLFFPSSHGDDQEDQHYEKEKAKAVSVNSLAAPPSWGK